MYTLAAGYGVWASILGMWKLWDDPDIGPSEDIPSDGSRFERYAVKAVELVAHEMIGKASFLVLVGFVAIGAVYDIVGGAAFEFRRQLRTLRAGSTDLRHSKTPPSDPPYGS